MRRITYALVSTLIVFPLSSCDGGSVPTTSPFFGVVATDPVDGATGVALGSAITVTFNRDVEPASLVGAIAVTSTSGDLAGVVSSYNTTTRTATFTPGAPFHPMTVYTVTVAAKVKCVDTVRLQTPYVFEFTSGAASQ